MQTLIEQPGSLPTKNDELRKELAAIASKRAGLNPSTLLAHAKHPKSVFHGYFTWDDTEAARRWREAQAYELIRRVNVTIETPEGREITVRAFWPVKKVEADGTIDQGKRGSFMEIGVAMTNKEAIDQIVDNAKKELAAFSTKYSKLQELLQFQNLFAEIKKVTK